MSPRHLPVTFATPQLDETIERDRNRFKTAELAPITRLSYERDFRVFRAWCEACQPHRSALPATEDTVELYAVWMLRHGRRVTTLERHAVGIQHLHRLSGHPSPCGPSLRRLLTGAKRTLCQRAIQKEALTAAEVRRIAKKLGHRTPKAARDRGIILFGVGSSLRRSNLAALQLADLTFQKRGVLVRIGKEKTDRRGDGRTLAVCRGGSACPVKALEQWVEHRGRDPGPLFCHVMRGRPVMKPLLGNRINQIVKEAVASIGLDPRKYGAHTLRASFVSIGLANRVNELALAKQTNHRDLATLALYNRTRNPWVGNASGLLGL